MLKPKGPFCQSCGMPMNKDQGGGGTEADGQKSQNYCSHCYQGGQFTEPTLTAKEMQQKVMGKLRDMHIPGFVGARLTKNIPKLKRWQTANQKPPSRGGRAAKVFGLRRQAMKSRKEG